MIVTKYTKQNPPSFETFSKAYSLLEVSFPSDERRSFLNQQLLFQNKPSYEMLLSQDETSANALLTLWHFPRFIFVEHLAVSPNLRGQGHGSELIKKHLFSQKLPVVLEVELPENSLARRRIEFYKRLGFTLNTYPYRQPPYEKGKAPLSLYLMSYPKELSKEDYEMVCENLYQTVYESKKETL